MFVPDRKHIGLHGLLGGKRSFLYVDDVRTRQETHLWASTACYGDSFTLLYVEDVRTSQETYIGLHVRYGDSFLPMQFLGPAENGT
jgi:hypothetical protein